MATQVHVFVFGKKEGMTRYCLTRAEPNTLDEAFALALREDYTVAKSYFQAASQRPRTSGPEPMKIDVIGTSRGRGKQFGRDIRSQNTMKCYRCGKTGHLAAVCLGPAPVSISTAVLREDIVSSTVPPKASGSSRRGALYWHEGAPSIQVAARTPRPQVIHTHLHATTTRDDSRLIIISLVIAGVNDHSERFTVREGPGDIVVKLADGQPQRVPRKTVVLPYTFDGFQSNDEFLVYEMNYAFDCILGIPWLSRYQPTIDWLSRSVKRRSGYDVSEVFTHLLVAPSDWPHVRVVNELATTRSQHRESDGPLCPVCSVTVIEPQHEAVEQRFPQTQTSVEQGLPIHNETVEQRFPHTQTSVEQGLPIHNEAVEQGFPHTRTSVEQGLPHTHTTAEQRIPIVTEVVEQRLPHTSEAVDDELPPLIDENERAVDLNVNDVVETELPRLAGGGYFILQRQRRSSLEQWLKTQEKA
uniref:CCHC-type domain-containing protein n=1 Tax=Peronospora matthiolae TaxID=2874970 RepID=A0AAV1TZ10_9STRA